MVNSKRGFLTVEFVLVVLAFMIILLAFSSTLNTFIPSELDKIRSATTCVQAELLADALLNFPGVGADWQVDGAEFSRLGFSTINSTELNYSKWAEAQNNTFVNITNQTGLNQSFLIKYSAYVVKPVDFPTLFISGNPGPAESLVVYTPNSSMVGIYARNSLDERHLVARVELFFPFSNITGVMTDDFLDSPPESSDGITVSNESTGLGGTLIVNLNLQSDSDQVRVNLTRPIEILFIRELSFRSVNGTLSKDYPIFYNRVVGATAEPCDSDECPEFGTLLKDSFGSSGFLDASKSFCEIKRKMIMLNGTHKLGVDISVISKS